MELRPYFLGQAEPAAVVLERVVRVDPALHADLGRPEIDRLGDPRLELVLADVVGVGRAPPLAESAEGAADRADVGEVDVAVDDERRRIAGQLLPQRVGGHPHRFDDVRARLGEQRRQLGLRQHLPAPALVDRHRRQLGIDRVLDPAARALARDEAPVLELDHVEHPLLDPLRLEVLGIDAESLGEGEPLRGKTLPDLVRAREGMLGGDVVAVRREAAQVGGAGGDQLVPPVREVRRHLDADVGHQALCLGD
jgi:hypothetical protein